jgi:hypothetical protein
VKKVGHHFREKPVTLPNIVYISRRVRAGSGRVPGPPGTPSPGAPGTPSPGAPGTPSPGPKKWHFPAWKVGTFFHFFSRKIWRNFRLPNTPWGPSWGTRFPPWGPLGPPGAPQRPPGPLGSRFRRLAHPYRLNRVCSAKPPSSGAPGPGSPFLGSLGSQESAPGAVFLGSWRFGRHPGDPSLGHRFPPGAPSGTPWDTLLSPLGTPTFRSLFSPSSAIPPYPPNQALGGRHPCGPRPSSSGELEVWYPR